LGALYEILLSHPITPSDVFYLSDGPNPNDSGRELLYSTIDEYSCDDPKNELIGDAVTGEVFLLLSGEDDASIVLCRNSTVIGVLYHTLIDGDGDDDGRRS